MTEIKAARPLAVFGNSMTTDHASPAGSIKPGSPAGEYLLARIGSFPGQPIFLGIILLMVALWMLANSALQM